MRGRECGKGERKGGRVLREWRGEAIILSDEREDEER